jgi:hypothetical protein
LSPDYPGQVDWIIQEVTKMPVRQVTETVSIEKNTANVISPAHNLMMNGGYPLVTLWDRPPAKARSLRWTYGIADARSQVVIFLEFFVTSPTH